MGIGTSSAEQNSPDSTLVRVPRYTLEEKRKKHSKLNTLKKKLSRSKGGFKSHDHGKMLRDLTQTWTTQEINALVEEYEAMLNVKELKSQTNLVRQSAPSLKKDLLRLFEEGICADMTLVFENTHFHVHKAILSSRCPYFKDLFSQHSEPDPVIHMEFKTEGMTTEIFSALLCYLYTGDFTPKRSGLEYIDVLINLGEEFGTPNVLEQDLKLLFNSGDYADVAFVFPAQDSSDAFTSADGSTISDHTYEIFCHKAILCARSPYFRSLFLKKDVNLPEDRSTSSVTRLVLDESVMTRQYTRIVLQCMYTDSVDLSSVVKWSSEDKRYYASGTHKLLTSAEIAMEVFEVASFIDLPVLIQGCEDIILEELSPSTLLPTLEWSSLPHGSDWVYRQAMQFLQDEFVNIAQTDAFSFIPKMYLAEALKSDFLQVFDILSITENQVKIISIISNLVTTKVLTFFVSQAILEEHKEAEVELIRHRMSRVSHNMPDTLYMVGSQKRSNTAPALFLQAAAAGRLEQDDRPSTAQSSNKSDNELDRYVRNRRTSEVNTGERESVGADRRAERELALPDVAMELPSHFPSDYWDRGPGPSSAHPFGVEIPDYIMGPVPDVALPSSPTSSVSSSGVPPEYFQMDQSLEALNDEGSSGSS
ncbi:BTB/POZ domain-containing protein 7-like [Orbicella faveolata]|uniref:BTB/POZ domain-containing protein 7-like n=1 Tax=Orbicella faveolata TaxID=48498 RepID=UPI0009E3883F|nr:BTB/POZ domain-containing protein 7-like [Orbicella faveolata]